MTNFLTAVIVFESKFNEQMNTGSGVFEGSCGNFWTQLSGEYTKHTKKKKKNTKTVLVNFG